MIRGECEACGRYVQYLVQTREHVALADAAEASREQSWLFAGGQG
jgi:hypothetical protein